MSKPTINLIQRGEDYWAEKYTDSELLLRHLMHGERKFWGASTLEDVTKLANRHGWEVAVMQYTPD